MRIRAERAISPTDGEVSWVVIDSRCRLHDEGSTFLAGLRNMGRSINTQRAYAGRVALYLAWCEERGVDWRRAAVLDLARFLRWLVNEPLPPRGKLASEPRFRSKKTANAVMTAVVEFLRFATKQEWVDPVAVARLSEPKYLHWMPPGKEAGEDGQFREVRARLLKFGVGEDTYEWLQPQDIERLLAAATHARDRFLVALLAQTGVRIGEALGLRRQDMHLLADSQMLGCQIAGPHIHVRRRAENSNGALAKSRFPRSIPVEPELVTLYADYQFERETVTEAAECDMVFVNLFHAPLGKPMRYGTAKELFDRLATKTTLTARPHMLRHGACTAWIRAGVERDVVSEMMGHVSPTSLEPYLHPTEDDKREAMRLVAAARARG
ncbi:tyrosine-type recombinase/integrase [Streptomyces sp. 2A115]|uniref:tyrosine-type recombinase/integrase n=1 Tax=Streptomyces sp. 2A115 TaxID=3457439 RepID=UPI003FD40B6C